MTVDPEDYGQRVLTHLRRYRPKQYAAAKRDGSLREQVKSLAESIADWINSQLPSEDNLKGLSQHEKLRKHIEALRFAESDALRELLPRDEETDALIGHSGGYEDPVDQ